MKAKDLMIVQQDFLRPDNTLKEAVNCMITAKRNEERRGVKGLPVLDPAGRLVGMLSIRDIFRAVYPSYLSMSNLGGFTWDGMVESLAKHAAQEKVADHMSRDTITVKEMDSLMECVDLFIKHDKEHLPVLNQEGRITGMIYERDIFCAIASAMLDNGKDACK